MATETDNIHLKNLHKTINEEGMNKRSYSSAEESDDDDSDNDMLVKFVSKKNKQSNQFDAVGYAFKLNNKISKLRSELARNEERHRYLQLDHNNKNVELDQMKERIIKQLEIIKAKSEIIKNNEIVLKKNEILISNPKIECTFYKIILIISFFSNILYYFHFL